MKVLVKFKSGKKTTLENVRNYGLLKIERFAWIEIDGNKSFINMDEISYIGNYDLDNNVLMLDEEDNNG